MSESNDQSVTRWIADLRRGDDEAIRQLWDRYFQQVVRLARKKLGAAPRRVSDEEDVALSVFRRLCAGAEEGRFERLNDRDDLWRLLVVITSNRVIDQQRHDGNQKRGGGMVRGESGLNLDLSSAPQSQLVDSAPTPEVLAQMTEEHQRLMARLDDDLQQVAVLKMDGFRLEEIAQRLGITSRSVQRKLNRIRETWVEDLQV
jgi:RNA polymerase sigma factor (sigma-70 family)